MEKPNYDFEPTFEELNDFLDGMIDIAEDMFIQIEDREQIDFGRFCLSTIDELKELKTATSALYRKMEKIRDDLALDPRYAKLTRAQNGLRKIEIEVTEGMIRQSLLSLTQAKKANLVALGEQFTIKTPNGGEFSTDLIDPGNKLRERGQIRAFYEQNGISPADHVLLTETEKGIWRMEVGKRSSGDPLSELLSDRKGEKP